VLSHRPAALVQRLSREIALRCDAAGTLTWADERAEQQLDAQSGRPFASLLAPGSEEKAARLLDAARAGQTEDWELIVVRHNVPAVFTFAGAPDGNDVLLVGSLVSERYRTTLEQLNVVLGEMGTLHRRADEAARAREAERNWLQQVLDTLPEGVLIVDAQGRFTLSNAAAAELLGADVIGRKLPFDDREAAQDYGVRRLDGTPYPTSELPLQRSLLGGEIVRAEQFLLRNARDGRDVPVLANSTPLRGPDNRIAGCVIIFQDIAAIKDLERQKDDFLASAAHDLRNPLTSIKGRADLLRRQIVRADLPNAERLLAGLGQIEASGTRMAALIDTVMDLAQLQMGRPLELRRQPTDLVALVRSAVAEQQQLAEGHEIRLKARSSALIGAWDPARLERVVQNLLSNAIKYSPDGGEVLVTVSQQAADTGAWAVLAVRDRGLGIPPADLPRLFERFHRGGNVVGQIAGTGIGLASSRQIVEQHGGSIAVQSRLGKGSTFTVRLPLGS
jgi:PAS domain S-box-containing protein